MYDPDLADDLARAVKRHRRLSPFFDGLPGGCKPLVYLLPNCPWNCAWIERIDRLAMGLTLWKAFCNGLSGFSGIDYVQARNGRKERSMPNHAISARRDRDEARSHQYGRVILRSRRSPDHSRQQVKRPSRSSNRRWGLERGETSPDPSIHMPTLLEIASVHSVRLERSPERASQAGDIEAASLWRFEFARYFPATGREPAMAREAAESPLST